MVKVKPVTYSPVDGELDGGIAMLQAATVLDAATELAVESKNVDKLLDIAAMWISLSKNLEFELEESETDVNSQGGKAFGFTLNVECNDKNEEESEDA